MKWKGRLGACAFALIFVPAVLCAQQTAAPSILRKVAIEQRLNEQVPSELAFRDEEGRTAYIILKGRVRQGFEVSPGSEVWFLTGEPGDLFGFGSLIAPRPCFWEVGARDRLISPKWAEEALTRMRRAYGAYGAEDQLRVDRFEGGHEWSGRVAYPLLETMFR